jgi:large subunit ribosomal protein L23
LAEKKRKPHKLKERASDEIARFYRSNQKNTKAMKLSEVLIKPILTEKANGQQEKLRCYAFRVDRKANKLEIKKAIEEFYGVTIVEVNTLVVPGKNKTRYTKKGFTKGQKPAYKKALVTVAQGETIDLYSAI